MVVIFHLGIAGVAIATLIAQAVSAVLVTYTLMASNDLIRLHLKRIRLHGSVLKSQLRIGLPGGFQTIMYSISNIVIQAALNDYGTDTMAAWAAYGKLDAIFWMISGAFGIAITTFVGQNYGAGKYSRVKKSVRVCMGIDFIASLILVVFLMVARVPLFHIFTTDARVVEIGSEMLAMITPCYIFFVFIEVLSGALRGIGDVIVPMIITMCGVCLLRVLWIIIAVPIKPGIATIIYSYPVTWIVSAVLFLACLLHIQNTETRECKIKKKSIRLFISPAVWTSFSSFITSVLSAIFLSMHRGVTQASQKSRTPDIPATLMSAWEIPILHQVHPDHSDNYHASYHNHHGSQGFPCSTEHPRQAPWEMLMQI